MKQNQDRNNIRRQLQKLKRKDRKDDMIDCSTIEDYEVTSLREESPKKFDPYEYDPSGDDSESERVSSRNGHSRSSTFKLQSSDLESFESVMENRERSVSHQGYHIGNKDTCWVCNASKSNPTVVSFLQCKKNLQVVCANAQEIDVWSKFLELLRDGVSKFFWLAVNMMVYLLNNPTPLFVLLGMLSFYFVLMYLELSVASLIELCAQILWPISHIFLRGLERFFRLSSAFMGRLDDLGQGVYCDLAEHWCKRFSMMCANRCSFVDIAINKMR